MTLADARAVLKDAARQPVNAKLFNELQTAAKSLNTPGGPTATVLVQQMFDDVILGNSANASWTGGAAAASTLGNLSTTSTDTQFKELIGKWFLGSDMPGDASAPGQSPIGIVYEPYALPLFNSVGPVIADVSQGQLGDCWFLAALGETAMQHPSLISKMIVPHGLSYSVQFWVNGRAKFVPVNDALPTYIDGLAQCNGSPMTVANSTKSLWVPLVEKALAQLSEQKGVVTGMEYPGGVNQYYEINAGLGEGIGFITGQETADYSIGGLDSSAISSLLHQMHSAFTAGEDVLLGTSEQAVTGNLVAGHMFAVTGIDTVAGIVSLFNPWGENAAGNGKLDNFTIAATALEADNAFFYAAIGAAKAA